MAGDGDIGKHAALGDELGREIVSHVVIQGHPAIKPKDIVIECVLAVSRFAFWKKPEAAVDIGAGDCQAEGGRILPLPVKGLGSVVRFQCQAIDLAGREF